MCAGESLFHADPNASMRSGHFVPIRPDPFHHRFLSNFVSDAGKLIPRRITRLPAKLQHRVAAGVKTARAMAIMPYTEKLALFARKSRNPYK